LYFRIDGQAPAPTVAGSNVPKLDGTLPIPEEEFKPVLDAAVEEINVRNGSGATRREWADYVLWAGVAISAVTALIACIVSKTSPASGPSDQEKLDAILRNQSGWIGVVIAVLISVATVPSTVAGRLNEEALRYENSARELNETLSRTQDKLYDGSGNTSRGQARAALNDLKVAIGKRNK
jgi:hypothetical protein